MMPGLQMNKETQKRLMECITFNSSVQIRKELPISDQVSGYNYREFAKNANFVCLNGMNDARKAVSLLTEDWYGHIEDTANFFYSVLMGVAYSKRAMHLKTKFPKEAMNSLKWADEIVRSVTTPRRVEKPRFTLGLAYEAVTKLSINEIAFFTRLSVWGLILMLERSLPYIERDDEWGELLDDMSRSRYIPRDVRADTMRKKLDSIKHYYMLGEDPNSESSREPDFRANVGNGSPNMPDLEDTKGRALGDMLRIYYQYCTSGNTRVTEEERMFFAQAVMELCDGDIDILDNNTAVRSLFRNDANKIGIAVSLFSDVLLECCKIWEQTHYNHYDHVICHRIVSENRDYFKWTSNFCGQVIPSLSGDVRENLIGLCLWSLCYWGSLRSRSGDSSFDNLFIGVYKCIYDGTGVPRNVSEVYNKLESEYWKMYSKRAFSV